MGITHVKGDFFDREHTAAHEAFGFHKGVAGVEGHGALGYKPPMMAEVKGNNRFAKGGQPHSDAAQDRVLIKKMMAQHDRAEGEKPVGLARGGRAILPRGMKPAAMQTHSPIGSPPRKPQVTRTPTNAMPGGEMPYGIQPSTEAGYGSAMAGDPGAPPSGLKRGGRVRRADGGSADAQIEQKEELYDRQGYPIKGQGYDRYGNVLPGWGMNRSRTIVMETIPREKDAVSNDKSQDNRDGLKRGGRVRRADGGSMGMDDSGSMGNLGISQPQGLKKGGRAC